MTRFILWTYQLLLTLLMPLVLLWWAVAAFFRPSYREGWKERLGMVPRAPESTVWIHGASLGEIRAATPLIRALQERSIPLRVTATSPAGRREARNLVNSGGEAHLMPLDHFVPLSLTFRAARPSVLVIAETELWPGLLWAAHTRHVPIIIVSGRISDKTFPNYFKFRTPLGMLLKLVSTIQAQAPVDAERYLLLGAEEGRVFVGGNMKFDLPPPDGADAVAVSLRRAMAGGWRVFVGGSVHPGEASVVLEAAQKVTALGLPVGLVLAPRHLEKIPEIERELSEQGGKTIYWSNLAKPLEASIIKAFTEGAVIVVDRVGLLARLYGGAQAAFVGGSLVPVGGHNLLEPLRWGVPVLFGPYMTNSPDIREEVEKKGLGSLVTNADSLAEALTAYLKDEKLRKRIKKEAGSFFEGNRGALAMALEAIMAARTAAWEADHRDVS